VRVSQSALSLAFLVVLRRLRMLTLAAALIVLAVTMLVHLGWAHCRCRSAGLAPGRASGARHDYTLDLRMMFILKKLA